MDFLLVNVKRSAWASRGISLQRGNRLFNGLAARARTLAYLSAPEHVGWGGIVDVPQQAPPLFSSEAPDGYYLFEFGRSGGLLDLARITARYPLSVCQR